MTKAGILSRREFVTCAAAGIATLAGRRGEAAGRPNILFVFADQMRSSAMGCMGNSYVKTPNVDKLASQGILFVNAFASAPLCTPYRAQLLTGRYSHTTGVVGNDNKMSDSEITLAKALKKEGYATGYIGKWHLSAGRRAPAGTPEEQGFVAPKDRQGFDYWAALECSHNYYRTWYYRDTPERILIDGYEPDVQTDLAIEFARQHKDGPFLLMMSWGPPHNPYRPPAKFAIYDPATVPIPPNVPKEFEGRARRDLADYYGLVTSLDENMGRIMTALDEMGIARNTIVCFTSDHGDMHYSHGYTMKGRPYEEAMHIPFILRYPKEIKPGQRKDLLFNSVDVMPSLLALCGLKPPEGVQGKELSAVILGKSSDEPESAYLGLLPANRGTSAWRAVRTKDWLYAANTKGGYLLYNVKEDPYELKNLLDDPAFHNIRLKLHALLLKWIREIGEDFPIAG